MCTEGTAVTIVVCVCIVVIIIIVVIALLVRYYIKENARFTTPYIVYNIVWSLYTTM